MKRISKKAIAFIAGLIMIVVASGTIFYACQKENEVVNQTTSEIKEMKKDGKNQFGIYFSYTNADGQKVTAYVEWRGGKSGSDGCCADGRGICEVESGIRFGSVGTGNQGNPIDNGEVSGYIESHIYVREDGSLYTCILTEEAPPPANDADGDSFYIDRDLYTSKDPFGYSYMIPKGVYPLDKTLGENGGFTIPIILQ
jgi:hypothetical protein